MKWFKRTCWVAAWGVWSLLAYGLYRELPYRSAAKVSTLPAGVYETILGFLGETETIVGFTASYAKPVEFRLFNARTGVAESSIDGPIAPLDVGNISLEHGVVFGRVPPQSPRDPPKGYGFLDLRTGKWAEINFHVGSGPFFHPWRPLVMLYPASKVEDDVIVVDCKTGRKLFGWRVKDGKTTDFYCSFFIGVDRIGVCCRRRKPYGVAYRKEDFDIEVWGIDDHEQRPRIFEGVFIGPGRTFSHDGRAAWNHNHDMGIDVFDFGGDGRVFSRAAEGRDESDWSSYLRAGPVVSGDGNTVLDLDRHQLWRVDDGRLLWSRRVGEKVQANAAEAMQRGGRFQTTEVWTLEIGPWSPSITTFAVRDLQTGDLHYRTTDLSFDEQHISADGKLAFAGSDVYALPPPRNWVLIVVCQAILASPLILVRTALRWRRRRRITTVSVAP